MTMTAPHIIVVYLISALYNDKDYISVPCVNFSTDIIYVVHLLGLST
jgi:hypothetical protein